MKSKSLMLMGLSIGFGLIAAIGITQVMGRSGGNSQPTTKMGSVLVAADDLDIYAELTEENVKLENWPSNIIPEDAVTSIEQIKDNIVQARISRGMPLVSSVMINKKKHIRVEIPEGFKLVAIKVSGDDTMNGLLNPGDKVDVMGFFKKRVPGGQTQTTSRTFLKALRVFSVNGRTRAGDREESVSSGNAIVSVLVNEKQSEDIYFAQQTGEIKLVMRGETAPGDDQVDDITSLMEDWNSDASDVSFGGDDIEPAFAQPAKTQSMIIWERGSPRKVEFVNNELPVESGAKSPAEEEEYEDEVIDEDSGDFDGSADIDR